MVDIAKSIKLAHVVDVHFEFYLVANKLMIDDFLSMNSMIFSILSLP